MAVEHAEHVCDEPGASRSLEVVGVHESHPLLQAIGLPRVGKEIVALRDRSRQLEVAVARGGARKLRRTVSSYSRQGRATHDQMFLLGLRKLIELEIYAVHLVPVDLPVNLSKCQTAGFRLCSCGAVPLDGGT